MPLALNPLDAIPLLTALGALGMYLVLSAETGRLRVLVAGALPGARVACVLRARRRGDSAGHPGEELAA
jgi:hypothetical protein